MPLVPQRGTSETARARAPRMSLIPDPLAFARPRSSSPARPGSAQIAAPKSPSPHLQTLRRFHPLAPLSLAPLLQKRRLASKCSLSRRPKTAPEHLHPPRRASFPPAVASSSAPASPPAPNESQTPFAVLPPSPASDSPRSCTKSAAPAPPWQTAPSVPARNRAA